MSLTALCLYALLLAMVFVLVPAWMWREGRTPKGREVYWLIVGLFLGFGSLATVVYLIAMTAWVGD